MYQQIADVAFGTIGAIVAIGIIFAVPFFRDAVGKFVAGFAQHHFDKRIEKLKSDLRQSEEKFAAELRSNEQQLRSLSDSTLSLRSNRQAAFDARRLLAVERLWIAKCSLDRLRLAAFFVSALNTDAMLEDADDPAIQKFASSLDKAVGIDLTKDTAIMTAMTEQPFIPEAVWVPFAAFKSVLFYAVVFLKTASLGALHSLKKEDLTKPLMLLALPEYAKYIEDHGVAGYYNLLPILEQKMLQALAEMFDGKEADHTMLKRSAEILAAARNIEDANGVTIPTALRDVELPTP